METEPTKKGPRMASPEEMRESALRTPVRTAEEAIAQMKRLKEFRAQEEAKRAAEGSATKR